MPVAFLHAQRVQRVVAGQPQAEGLAGGHQCVEHGRGALGRDVELPAQFADISDAAGAHPGIGQVNGLRGAERKSAVGQIGIGQGGQQFARARSHQAQHGHAGADIGGDGPRVWRYLALQPGEVAHLGGRSGDDQKAVWRLARHGQVGLDAATHIEPLGVDDLAHRHGDVVGADLVEHALGIRPLHQKLGKRRLVKQADRLAHRQMLLR